MARDRRRNLAGSPRPPKHDLRPPRYRLLTAAAKLPTREPEDPKVTFERDCPACGEAVLFTQVGGPEGPAYLVDDHDCV